MTCEFAPVSTSIHTGSPAIVPCTSGNGKARPLSSNLSVTRRGPVGVSVVDVEGLGTVAATMGPGTGAEGTGGACAPPQPEIAFASPIHPTGVVPQPASRRISIPV